ncbi:unnamed protein product, partial [Rotaria sordida]
MSELSLESSYQMIINQNKTETENDANSQQDTFKTIEQFSAETNRTTFMRTALRIPARVIYDELNSVYGDEAPGLSTIERWSKLFRDGREEVEDKPRPGRPISETTTENIEQ